MNPGEETNNATRALRTYIETHSQKFKELSALRELGWKNERGDEFFNNQRARADTATATQKDYFFKMMQNIGHDMDQRTSFVSQFDSSAREFAFLDLGGGPGGFAQFVLNNITSARLCEITLPPASGGYELELNINDSRIDAYYLDVTMLTQTILGESFSLSSIPIHHPDNESLKTQWPSSLNSFRLVICAASVVRNHERHQYREHSHIETTRLLTTQLVIALSKLEVGGTMVLLLHKPETLQNFWLLHTLSQFADIQFFKHPKSHAIRSAFYVVAKNVQSNSLEAKAAIDTWRDAWRKTTFQDGKVELPSEEQIMLAIDTFGEQFLRLATPVWDIQMRALRRSDITKTPSSQGNQHAGRKFS